MGEITCAKAFSGLIQKLPVLKCLRLCEMVDGQLKAVEAC